MGDSVEERLTALEIGQAEIKVQQEVLKNVQEQQEKRIAKNEEYREKAIETDYEIKSSIKELVNANTVLVDSNKELSKTVKEVVTKVDSMCMAIEKTNDRIDKTDNRIDIVQEYVDEKKNESKKTIADIKSTFIKRVVEIIIVIIAIALGLAKYL